MITAINNYLIENSNNNNQNKNEVIKTIKKEKSKDNIFDIKNSNINKNQLKENEKKVILKNIKERKQQFI